MRALLTGILGMTAFHTVELLHSKGYLLYGVIKKNTDPFRIEEIKKRIPGVILFRADIANKEEVSAIIKKVHPDEMYNFAGISDIFNPYENPDLVMQVNGHAPRYMLECIYEYSPHTKFFQASSSLVFKNTSEPKNEQSEKAPSLPYGVAKNYADKYVAKYRDLGVLACSGFLFSHSSERRNEKFFTRKVTKAVAEIKLGFRKKLEVGNLDVERDMGYAPDYAYAAYSLLQRESPQDFIIGTGTLTYLRDFVSKCFLCAGLSMSDYVVEDQSKKRTDESAYLADTALFEQVFNWNPSADITRVISNMINHDISLLKNKTA